MSYLLWLVGSIAQLVEYLPHGLKIPFKVEFLAVTNGPSNNLGLAEFRSNFTSLTVSSKTIEGLSSTLRGLTLNDKNETFAICL